MDPNEQFLEAMRHDPVLFCNEILGVDLWHKQEEVLFSVRDNKYTAVASGHATGKTFIMACVVLWYTTCFPDAIVLTTANSWLQVSNVLWTEVRRRYERAVWPIGAKFKPKAPRFDFHGNFALGFSPDKPDAVNGYHRSNILIIFDEAQGIQDQRTWDAFSGMMTSEGSKWAVIGNPLYPYGPFRACFKASKWNQIYISCLDHPNVLTGHEIFPGAVTQKAIEELRHDPLKGEGSLYWDTRVAGVFPELGEDVVIPETFVKRCLTTEIPKDQPLLPGTWLGLDPAGFGDDRSAVAVLKDGVIVHLESWRACHISRTVNRTLKIAIQHNVPLHHINFDAHGGTGADAKRAFDAARVPANPVYVGGGPAGDWSFWFGRDFQIQFLNRRAELHWAMRRLFEDQAIAIQPRFYEKFVMEACELKYGVNDQGKLWIESKPNKYKPRMGFSPDHSDAVLMCLPRDQKNPGAAAGEKVKLGVDKYDPTGQYVASKRERPGSEW